MAVLADFSGRGNRGLCQSGPLLATRRRFAVDIDSLEGLPGLMGCEIRVPLGGRDTPRIVLQFRELSDFHPDRIFGRLEVFRRLEATRKLLQDPATFGAAAAQVRSWLAGPQEREIEPSDAAAEQDDRAPDESDAETIGRLLGNRPDRDPSSAPGDSRADIESLLREVVGPYVVPAPDPQQDELTAQVDQAISGQMRAILHHPDLQALEAAWRALHLLVSRLETDETLKVYVIDVSKAELAADLGSGDPLPATGTYKLLAEQSAGVPGAEPYAVLVGGYQFDQTTEDVALLRQLARVAQAAGAPWLAGADPHFAGCASLAVTPDPDDWQYQADPAAARLWQELRRSPEAACIGLALPRFLLRLPYGTDTDPVDRFAFEEFVPLASHEQYLWGNPATACACLLATAFRECGWNLTGGLGCDLADIPLHIYESDGQRHVTPCAETILTERATNVLINNALMPVVSLKGRDITRIPRFQSIADPPASLAGRWR
ncbi:MAG: type VI secretion system contractile sheath large subunit [Sedimentisphaerales bacterium]|nr:type VI secretion system contractile sheath large subunit [Sedimentisphaerales bacterium]